LKYSERFREITKEQSIGSQTARFNETHIDADINYTHISNQDIGLDVLKQSNESSIESFYGDTGSDASI